jgi:hypothetical protein
MMWHQQPNSQPRVLERFAATPVICGKGICRGIAMHGHAQPWVQDGFRAKAVNQMIDAAGLLGAASDSA